MWRPPKCNTHKVKDKWQHYLMSRCQRGSAQAPFGEKELVLMAFDCVGGKNNKKKAVIRLETLSHHLSVCEGSLSQLGQGVSGMDSSTPHDPDE